MFLWILLLSHVLIVHGGSITTGWTSCHQVDGSTDQNCNGLQERYKYDDKYSPPDMSNLENDRHVTKEVRTCKLTHEPVDGGYSEWTPWDSCFGMCTGTTWMYRYCTNPTPCNGGSDCKVLGRDKLRKKCGAVDGQWGEWGAWGACDVATTYGTGNRVRYRLCNKPEPQCAGDYCVGSDSEYDNCRNVPNCLTYDMFNPKFLKISYPMRIYHSAQIDVYLLTKNTCSRSIIIHTKWKLYRILNSTSMEEVKVASNSGVKFEFNPDQFEVGLYRLYAKVGYPNKHMPHWMEESMYVKIEQPPPHAAIAGGSGRTVGEGHIELDARSVSYSLEKGPGDPSDLHFQWQCFNFLSDNIYKLLEYNLPTTMAFGDQNENQVNWYETTYISTIENSYAFKYGSEMFNVLDTLRTANVTCMNATMLNVTVYVGGKTVSTPIEYELVQYNSTYSYTIQKTTVPFNEFYDIVYMEEYPYAKIGKKWDTTDIYPIPFNDKLVKNEFLEFLNILVGSEQIFSDAEIFLESLSSSLVTFQTLDGLKEMPHLPESANETFFESLEQWIGNVTLSLDSIRWLDESLHELRDIRPTLLYGTDFVDMCGIDAYFYLKVDDSEKCLLDLLSDIFDALTEVIGYDWNKKKTQERFFTDWIENELLHAEICPGFSGDDNGTAELDVERADIDIGVGYLAYVRVEYHGSVSYFIQHLQTVEGQSPSLSIECRFNCMEKLALTSITSIKASCTGCNYDQQKGSVYWWNIRHFDFDTRRSSDIQGWQTWVMSDINSRKFVIQSNVFNASSGYLLEVYMKQTSGELSMAMWIVHTNILPYGGSVTVEDALWDEKKVSTYNWMDEGFREMRNPAYDFKEQLSYRVLQRSGDEEVLLYYGCEEENHVDVMPGAPEDNYMVNITVHIVDIFLDYTEITVNLGQIKPKYTIDEASVNEYLHESDEAINYYWKMGNIKQVAMNAEVAAAAIKDLHTPDNLFKTDPTKWPSIGTTTDSDGNTTLLSFDELWNQLLHPDYGNETVHDEIVMQLDSFAQILSNATESLHVTSSIQVDHLTLGLGTLIQNKEFVAHSAVWNALEGNMELLHKLINLSYTEPYPKYEDYIKSVKDMLRLMSNALEGILPSSSPEIPKSLDIYSVMTDIDQRKELIETDLTEADLTHAEKAFIASRIALKNEFEAQNLYATTKLNVDFLIESIKTLGDVLKTLNYRKQLAVEVKKGYVRAIEDNMLMAELIDRGITNKDGVSLNFKERNSMTTEEQPIQVTTYDHTPFAWDEESKYITSKTVSVRIADGDTTNTAIPSKIKLPNKDISRKNVMVAIPVDPDEFTSQLIYQKLYWKNPADSLIFEISNASPHLTHTVFVSRKKNPTEEFDWKKVVGDADWTGNDITIVVPADLYSKETNVKIGILIEKGHSNNCTSSRRRRAATIEEYGLVGVTAGCRVWDSSSEKWNGVACKLSSSSTINETVCECANPPGNNFAATFYVPPNTIDFGTVFQKFDLKDNAAVFATVISLVLLYFLICIWAYRQDKKDPDRWALSYLKDNAFSDDYLYVISVYTGLRRNAGTSSNIQFMVISNEPDKKHNQKATAFSHPIPDIRRLEDGSNQGFSTGSVRKFVMTVSQKIDEPTVFKIWHDNSGEGHSASWYLDKVVMEDVQTNERYVFICNKWLSLDHDDGSIECAIPVCDKTDTHKFSFLFNEKTKQNTTDNHLWLSVGIRPERSNFSRMERLASCVALLFLTMISNAIFFGQDNGQRFTVGPLSFSPSGIYISIISALIVAPPIFFMTYLFRNSKRRLKSKKEDCILDPGELEKDDGTNTGEIIDNSQFPLPFWCRYLAWVLVTSAVVISGFFLILYSMEWGKSKSNDWLLCFLMSFFESMLIVDPLKIIVVSCVLSCIIGSKSTDAIKYNREALLMETKRRAISTVSFVVDMFKKTPYPKDTLEVADMKKKRKDQLRVQETFIELLVYIAMLVVLYMVSFSNRDMKWFHAKNHLDQHLVKPGPLTKGSYTIKLEQVSTVPQFYSWLDDTLLPYLFPQNNVNGNPLVAYDRLFVKDNVNYRVGPMRLRQVRVKEDDCKESVYENTTCFGGYNIITEEDSDYCVAWENPPCALGQNYHNLTSSAWTFKSAKEVWGLPVTGEYATYSGGGYIIEFVVNYNISRLLTQDLYNYIWINRRSRAVFVEFTLYNADNNVFLYVTFMCEFPETGGVYPSVSIKQFRPYQHVGNIGLVVFIFELILSVFMVIFSVRKVIFLCRTGRKSLKSFWNILDICIMTSFYLAVAMYIVRALTITDAMNDFEDNKNKFVNFGHIAFWDELFSSFLAFLIFFTTLRVIRFLSYNDRINQLARVMSNVSYDLFGCFLIFLVIYMAFMMFGCLLFGRNLETYKNLFVSSTTLINAIIGKNSINDLFSIEPVLGRFYYFFFVLFLLWILMTMLNATLNVGISKVRAKPIVSTYGISNVISSIWRETIGLIVATDKQMKPQSRKDKYTEIVNSDYLSKNIELVCSDIDKTYEESYNEGLKTDYML